MPHFHFPWLQVGIVLPLLGAILTARPNRPQHGRIDALVITGLALICMIGQRVDYCLLGDSSWVIDGSDWLSSFRLSPMFVVDEVSSLLLPIVGFLFWLVALATLKTKAKRFSFSGMLMGQSVLFALFSTPNERILIALSILTHLLPVLEYRQRGKSPRVYLIHVVLSAVLTVAGWSLYAFTINPSSRQIGLVMLAVGVLTRCGAFPFHCWVTDLYEHASFGTALLASTPLAGAYVAVRLLLPIAPPWLLTAMVAGGLATAVYCAGMALIQQDARRFFCFIFLSQSALVLVGFFSATPLGVAAGLCVWITVAMAMTGVGLTLRSLESRLGRISLNRFHGMYDHTPLLAILFMVTGLASIGFPGTMGFVSMEMLVDGIAGSSPRIASLIVISAALNGIALLQTYFRLFTGTKHHTTIDLQSRRPEWVATMILTSIIVGVGLYPQVWISSRYKAAVSLIQEHATHRLADQANRSANEDSVQGTFMASETVAHE